MALIQGSSGSGFFNELDMDDASVKILDLGVSRDDHGVGLAKLHASVMEVALGIMVEKRLRGREREGREAARGERGEDLGYGGGRRVEF